MSISVPLAVTMMIGTDERARMARHTSMPDSLGSMRSSRTRSGSGSSKRWSASLPSRATRHVEALAGQADDQRVDEGLLVLGQQHLGRLWSDGGDSVGPSDALSEGAFSDELGLSAEWAFPLLSARSVLALMRRTPVDWAGRA